MASKETPKKYVSKDKSETSRCRLCHSVADPVHSKSLFRETNRVLLRNAELICGSELQQVNGLPRRICRPCERRVNNTILFRNTIIQTQRLLIESSRTKRSIEISPSVTRPAAKVQAASSTQRRRSIDFELAATTRDNRENVDPTMLQVCKRLFKCFFDRILLYILIFLNFENGINNDNHSSIIQYTK